jgi:hypothetical protein
MGRRAYVLIETETGERYKVKDDLQKCEWVQSVERLTGPYDIIALANEGKSDTIDTVISESLKKMSGIIRVVVCPIPAVQ